MLCEPAPRDPPGVNRYLFGRFREFREERLVNVVAQGVGGSRSNEYLLLSRGQWDADKSKEEIQSVIDQFYVWHERLVSEGKFRPGYRLATGTKFVTQIGIIDGIPPSVAGAWFAEFQATRLARDLLRLKGIDADLRHDGAEICTSDPP
jgi:hypothetical protein